MALILLADDDESLRAIVQAMIKRLGHDVLVATDGNEALRLYRERGADLVITDLIMPEKEGLDTIRELRRTSDVKIIAMSGGGRTSPATYLTIAKHVGACVLLSKPFSHQELASAIETALSGSA